MKTILLITLFCFMNAANYAQTIEDALRYSGNNGIISARAGGLGAAYHGIVDDYSAIAFNPAGLALIDKGEMTFGLAFMNNSVETTFISEISTFASNDAYLSNLGLVAPFQTTMGNAAIAIGHYMDHNFDNSMDFASLNPYSTYTNFLNEDAKSRNLIPEENTAKNLFLADDNFNTPLKDRLYQEAFITESGGLHNISGGVGFELSEFLSAGFSLTGKWGTYEYLRQFQESDINQVYQRFDTSMSGDYIDLDFDKLIVDELVTQHISGFTGAVGIIGKIGNSMRMGLSVKFPTVYGVQRTFYSNADSYFDNGDSFNENYTIESDFTFISPWVYSAGMSLHFWNVTLSGGVEFSDLAQMEYEDDYNLNTVNLNIKKDMDTRIKYGIGAEFEIPGLPVVLRGSYNAMTAPYQNDIEGAEWTSIAFGAGVFLAPNIRMDFLFRNSGRTNYWNIYEGGDETKLYYTDKPNDFALQVTYRY